MTSPIALILKYHFWNKKIVIPDGLLHMSCYLETLRNDRLGWRGGLGEMTPPAIKHASCSGSCLVILAQGSQYLFLAFVDTNIHKNTNKNLKI